MYLLIVVPMKCTPVLTYQPPKDYVLCQNPTCMPDKQYRRVMCDLPSKEYALPHPQYCRMHAGHVECTLEAVAEKNECGCYNVPILRDRFVRLCKMTAGSHRFGSMQG